MKEELKHFALLKNITEEFYSHRVTSPPKQEVWKEAYELLSRKLKQYGQPIANLDIPYGIINTNPQKKRDLSIRDLVIVFGQVFIWDAEFNEDELSKKDNSKLKTTSHHKNSYVGLDVDNYFNGYVWYGIKISSYAYNSSLDFNWRFNQEFVMNGRSYDLISASSFDFGRTKKDESLFIRLAEMYGYRGDKYWDELEHQSNLLKAERLPHTIKKSLSRINKNASSWNYELISDYDDGNFNPYTSPSDITLEWETKTDDYVRVETIDYILHFSMEQEEDEIVLTQINPKTKKALYKLTDDFLENIT